MTDAPAIDSFGHLLLYVIFWSAVIVGVVAVAYIAFRRFFR